MNNDTNRIVVIFTELSEELKINPPTNADIDTWWCESLEEMSNHHLLILKEFILPFLSNEVELKKMYQSLIEQIRKRQL